MMETLKTKLQLGILFLFSLLIIGCDADDRIDLTEDPEERQEVYQQIINDDELLQEFLTEMRNSDQAMEMMAANRPMMRNMYGRNQMRRMMMNNPQVVDTMMQGMMMVMEQDTTMFRRNPELHRRMLQHIMVMMERDTSMYRQMQERMQQRQRNNTPQ
ncbi:hypothetical protein SAMN04488034_103282 [Salinimicrobium catena]|uniref:Uncharacterized protein n=1 Tax=Salinimicrobium catena TaxID=390640 RepID=A0A1H5N290_9FLAO|nr:hypothetical protein [Salinimicrobium catena]SDL35084.1 hypothetical protein SAMN04488140_103282 [Salinimicrobium catena]SEE95729.1 hypothetical protein SAMN04488034_103282 [Salinimicrobium catena]